MTNPNDMRWLSPSVAVTGHGAAARAVCASCGHDLGPAGDPWKASARRREVPLQQAGGAAYDNGDAAIVLRQFCCPACATLLETETAVAGDPVLTDRLAG